MREEKDMRVVNFGSLNIDYVYRVDHFVQPGETMSAQSLQIQCGGKGLNQSVALARAGVETWHAGLIGPEGHFLKETLDRAGVHTRFVEESAGSTGHAIIQVDSTGQNSILLHDGANGRLTPDFVTAVLDQFSAGDTVLLQNETSCVEEIIHQAARRGMRTAMNAAPANEKLVGLKKDLFYLRMQHATNQLDNPLKIRETKHDIARVKTMLRQKELSGASDKQ